MADVFISYKRSERSRVERLAKLLRESKMTVWFDAQLEAGRGEGFDAEIEREVTSAHCVIVCWTKDALKSVYVKAEAKKGLEREALVPVFLEHCQLPIPFNGIDTVDLTSWNGDESGPAWKRLLDTVLRKVESARADESRRKAQSLAAYEKVDHKLFPGALALLVPRITAISDWDARDYGDDISAVLQWMSSIAEKEKALHISGYEIAQRQSGGGAWMYWDRGDAEKRRDQIRKWQSTLATIAATLAQSESLLDSPAP